MKSVMQTRLKDRIGAAQIAVAVARAEWRAVDEIDRETKTAVLSSGKYREEDGGAIITNPRDDFMMSTEDFAEYCKEVYTANCAKGLDTGAWDLNFWPIQKAMIDAEGALLDLIPACIPQIDAKTHDRMKAYPHRQKALDLIMSVDAKTIPDHM